MRGGSMDLATFLEARIADDEAAARTVHDVAKCDAMLYEEDMAAYAARTPVCDCGYPARVLREAGAKRKILAYHAPEFTDYRDGDGIERGTYECTECDPGGSPDNWPCRTMRALAAVYADHKDYQQEWGQ